jgi:hypothetical protein
VDKLYKLLFFVAGLFWVVLPSVSYICFLILFLFYAINNMKLGVYSLSSSAKIFGVILLALVAHLAFTNVWEFVRHGYSPFQSVYSDWIKYLIKLIVIITSGFIISNLFKNI